jgi:hypothetical protein
MFMYFGMIYREAKVLILVAPTTTVLLKPKNHDD